MKKSTMYCLPESAARNGQGRFSFKLAFAAAVFASVLAVSVEVVGQDNSASHLRYASDGVSLMLSEAGLQTEDEMRKAATEYLNQFHSGADTQNFQIISIIDNGDQVTVNLMDQA